MNAIEIVGLTKRYGTRTILDCVTFSVGTGTICGLTGTHGCGKTTTLRIFATLERPTSGQLRILDRDVASAPRAARRCIGFVPEQFTPFSGLDLREHLDFTARCYRLSGNERGAMVESLLQLLDLADWQRTPVSHLSRGLLRRLALASALVHNPDVLLLDEPFALFDAQSRAEIAEVLKELRSMGKTIVLASQDQADIALVCDTIAALKRGDLLISNSAERVQSKESLPESGGHDVVGEGAKGLERQLE